MSRHFLSDQARRVRKLLSSRVRGAIGAATRLNDSGASNDDIMDALRVLDQRMAAIEQAVSADDGSAPGLELSQVTATPVDSPGPARPTEVVVITAPRSGTNFFCECLGEFPEMVGLYELFNPRGVFGLGSRGLLSDVAGRLCLDSLDSASDQVLIRQFREQPLASIAALGDVVADQGALGWSYKIFFDQLDRDVLTQLVAEPHRRFVFLVRARLDVFVSYVKAHEEDVWKNTSTKDLMPEIDVDEFMESARYADQWYEDMLELVRSHGRQHVFMVYDDDVNVPKGELLARVHDLLLGFGVEVSRVSDVAPKFRKQDRDVEPFGKIANGEQLRDTLRRRGLLDYALSAPLESVRAAVTG